MFFGRDMDFASDGYGEGGGRPWELMREGHSSQVPGEVDRNSLVAVSTYDKSVLHKRQTFGSGRSIYRNIGYTVPY